MKIFTADQHFGHEAIIEICDRPFKSAEGMDNALIKRYCEVVSDDDVVYMLGDFLYWGRSRKPYFEHIFERLPGRKHLIIGNHDRLLPRDYLEAGFYSVHTHLEIEIEGIGPVALVHDPVLSELNRSALFLCGHAHTLFTHIRNVVNVGVDVWDYMPVTEDQLIAYAAPMGWLDDRGK